MEGHNLLASALELRIVSMTAFTPCFLYPSLLAWYSLVLFSLLYKNDPTQCYQGLYFLMARKESDGPKQGRRGNKKGSMCMIGKAIMKQQNQ